MNRLVIILFILMGCYSKTDKPLEKDLIGFDGKIPIKFTYQPLTGGKHQVFLAGDFNNWSHTSDKMLEINGIYETTLYLKQGKYSYKFIVDGQWINDNNAKEFIGDGFGGQNSVVIVGDQTDINKLRYVTFIHKPSKKVKDVYLVGSMNDWNQKVHKMMEIKDGSYSITLILKEDEYEYKFVEDGIKWVVDSNAKEFVDDGFEGKNSLIIVNNTFEKVSINKKDGLFLTYGIQNIQSVENINPITSTKIEFKAKAHRNDVESIFVSIDNERILMDKVAEDNSFEYFQKIISIENENDIFNYCFIYKDGENELYLFDGEFSKVDNKEKYFTYSKELVPLFITPDWVKNGIIYQIFPDRFYDGSKNNNPDFSEWYYNGINTPPQDGKLFKKYTQYFHLVNDWYDISGLTTSPYHLPDEDGYQPDYNSFYGGDIEGVRKKLDYLEDLGITIIYFNPLFEAKSNHKYDAVDYMKIDPHFGTESEFKIFVKEAHSRGIRIIIDCAFNHTGETFGAFQDIIKKGPSSQYYNWYEWKQWPLPNSESNYKPSDYYECWWDHGEMPDLNFDLDEINPSENSTKNIDMANPNWEVVNYLLDVAEYWISDMDIDGFRLDVPNEVPFWFWELFREKVKSIKPDAYLVGELWNNAIEWVNDDYFDAVMNYAYFKDPVMRFFNMRKCNAATFDRDLKQGLLSYPTQATQIMMNLIDSHDTFRYLESASGDISKLKLAVLFQMTYVGVPHIWYGDEIGMMGAHDPDCRRPFNWKYIDDLEMVSIRDFYKKLISIRKENSSLRTGTFETLIIDNMVYGFLRSDNNSKIAVVINNDINANKVKIPFDKRKAVDLISGKVYISKGDGFEIELEPMSGVILK